MFEPVTQKQESCFKSQDGDVFASVPELIEILKKGEMIILVDDEDRENEGDLVLAAQHVSPEKINFMVKHAGGLICLALSPEQADRLQLRPMVDMPQNSFQTHFLVSIEAATGVTTGISAADRARTIYVASRPEATPLDIRTPGHVFPIRAKPGGVLQRAGHTEASVDLVKLAGLWPSAVICEIMKDDGSMARLPDLIGFARKHGLKIGTIDDLIRYRMCHENLVQEQSLESLSDWDLNLANPQWQLRLFENRVTGQKALVIVKKPLSSDSYVRMEKWLPFSWFNELISGQWPRWLKWLRWLDQHPEGFVWVLFFPFENHDPFKERQSGDIKEIGFGSQILRNLGIQAFKLVSQNSTWWELQPLLKAFGLEIRDIVEPPGGS